jgi:carbon storage regulator CsrA
MITFFCKRNESIVIGGRVVVTVLDIEGTSVELGIDDPDGAEVRRTEVVELACAAAGAWEE